MVDAKYQIVASPADRPEVDGLEPIRRDDSSCPLGPGTGAMRVRQSILARTRDWRADA
jgi:hypothetical protein